MKKILFFVLAGSLLSGCSIFNPGGSSDFSCPGMPSGVTCKTPREVYNTPDDSSGGKKTSGKKSKSNMPIYINALKPQDDLTPIPVLEQAQVMRIWIAPWTDKNKDLPWPGLVFTQIQPRQWTVGEDSFNGVEPPVPHQMFSSAQPAQVEQKKQQASPETTTKEEDQPFK